MRILNHRYSGRAARGERSSPFISHATHDTSARGHVRPAHLLSHLGSHTRYHREQAQARLGSRARGNRALKCKKCARQHRKRITAATSVSTKVKPFLCFLISRQIVRTAHQLAQRCECSLAPSQMSRHAYLAFPRT